MQDIQHMRLKLTDFTVGDEVRIVRILRRALKILSNPLILSNTADFTCVQRQFVSNVFLSDLIM